MLRLERWRGCGLPIRFGVYMPVDAQRHATAHYRYMPTPSRLLFAREYPRHQCQFRLLLCAERNTRGVPAGNDGRDDWCDDGSDDGSDDGCNDGRGDDWGNDGSNDRSDDGST